MLIKDITHNLNATTSSGSFGGKKAHPEWYDGTPGAPGLPEFTVVQKVITEREVATHLEKGFTFKAQLQNGTVIVETTIKAADIIALASET
jgi:hypothetical protein